MFDVANHTMLSIARCSSHSLGYPLKQNLREKNDTTNNDLASFCQTTIELADNNFYICSVLDRSLPVSL